jgi:hypothetical protein
LPNRHRYQRWGPGFLGDLVFYDLGGVDTGEFINQTGDPVFANFVSCWDVVGEHFDALGAERDHPFLLERIESEGTLTLSGSLFDSLEEARLSGWVPRELRFLYTVLADIGEETLIPDYRDLPFPAWLKHLDTGSLLVPVNRLLSRTNPSVPTVDIPSFLWEGLRDLPSLIYEKGTRLLSTAGGIDLKLEFGWKPLIADVKRMVKFGEELDKKLQDIQRLIKGKLKKKSSIQKDFIVQSDIFSFDMRGVPFEFDTDPPTFVVDRRTTLDQWGSVTYCLTRSAQAEFGRYGTNEKEWKAIRAILGLHTANPATLWEILPWSWLVDWFLPIQDLLDRYNNFIPTQVLNLNVMTTTQTAFIVGETTHDFLRVDKPLSIVRTTLERAVLAPDGTLPEVHASLPIVDVRRLSIVAAILAQRTKRGP